jgi:hypothetical protein
VRCKLANSNNYLTSPYPLTLSSSNNSFTSNWSDKRSAVSFGVSVVFYGANAPDGYCVIQTSNSPDTPGLIQGAPIADDAAILPGSQQTVVLNPVTGNYGYTYEISSNPARWFRVVYTSLENVSGLSVNVYQNTPYESP